MPKANKDQDEPLTQEMIHARVYQGLQKRKKCSLCLQTFYVDELPGAITYKSILELRQKWGEDIRKSNKLPSPSQLYKREELCIFCMQFFDVDGMVDAPAASSKGVKSPNASVRSPTRKNHSAAPAQHASHGGH